MPEDYQNVLSMGRVYEYIQHNFKGALQSKILKQVIDSFDKVYLQNMPKLGHINLEKIYAVNDVPILKPSKKTEKDEEQKRESRGNKYIFYKTLNLAA